MNAPVISAPVRTTCPYCGVGCGVVAQAQVDGINIAGDPEHPANFGRLCSKGAALGETLGLDGRLLHPMLRGADGELRRADWPSALDRVADGFRKIVERDGPDAVAFYLSGQLLTEDYYVANKLMKGFIGSGNVDTNSRLCMASSVAGHRRAFGSDTVPGSYEDLDSADVIVLVGANSAWCHPVLFQRMVRNRRERGAKIVVIDPRRTVTAEEADLFLPIAPGTDTALFCGLLVHLADRGMLDKAFVRDHTSGFAEALARARHISPNVMSTASRTGLHKADVARFFALFAETPRVVTCFSQGVNQSAQGTDKVGAIINVHLATGRIGKPGTGPFSLTGQPNAMGGREVGGLANQLAAHMGFAPQDVDRVGRFWNAPRMATREGLKAVDLFDAVADKRIKALWVMATNPAVSMPRAAAVRAAMEGLELFVVSDNVARTDTLGCRPHVLLPAAAWGEKDGTVTNSERRISRQRAFLPLPGDAKPDWWTVAQVAQRMGFAGFDYASAADIFREHAALSGFENDGARDFNLGGLADISDADFATFAPTQWPVRAGVADQSARFFAEGNFYFADRKARFALPEPPVLAAARSDRFSLRLNTGRVRDQWHTMTRSGRSIRLGSHRPEPFVEVHPRDAKRFALREGGYAELATAQGTCILKVAISEGQQPGLLFAPIHWSAETASFGRVGDLVAGYADPFSGQPELKATPVSVAPVAMEFAGFALARRPLAWPDGVLWARVAVEGGVGYLLAGNRVGDMMHPLGEPEFAGAELAEYVDAAAGSHRLAAFRDGEAQACIFAGPLAAAPSWDALRPLFGHGALAEEQRRHFLSGRRVDGQGGGPIVCSCFGVGLTTLRASIAARTATTVEDIGKALRAGTNCGSCLPELKRLLVTEAAAAS